MVLCKFRNKKKEVKDRRAPFPKEGRTYAQAWRAISTTRLRTLLPFHL